MNRAGKGCWSSFCLSWNSSWRSLQKTVKINACTWNYSEWESPTLRYENSLCKHSFSPSQRRKNVQHIAVIAWIRFPTGLYISGVWHCVLLNAYHIKRRRSQPRDGIVINNKEINPFNFDNLLKVTPLQLLFKVFHKINSSIIHS